MQFIKNGPDIPERLLQEHEDGRVVFFCGAGISYPARMPGFRGLVSKIYSGLGEAPSSIEQAAIKKGQYDTAIGLLEGRIVGGRATIREQLSNILAPDLTAPDATSTHEALLTLARNRKGHYRIVTTNFDHLFEEVISRQKLSLHSFQAPLLPVPKKRWDGLVYLHGLLPVAANGGNLDHLVVSSGDFGLAYLNERWAARFVSELFRTYTVCFVGYSINDPVLRYMMDALAADRLLGEVPIQAFAFGSYSKGKEREKSDEWRAKNVTPILYQEHRKHAYLHRTLRAWSDIYRDGISGKERIVAQYAMSKPMASTRQDDFVGRVLWALSDPRGLPAKLFADLNPPPPIEWLEPLTTNRFGYGDLIRFGVLPDSTKDEKLAFSHLQRPTPYRLAPLMALVHHRHDGTSQCDEVMSHLARWLSRHLSDPKLIIWIADRGDMLDTQFASFIKQSLDENPPSPQMQTLWRITLSGRLRSHLARSHLYDWDESFKRHGLTPILRLQLRELLTPYVRLTVPLSAVIGEDFVKETGPPRLRNLVDWEIVLGADHIHSVLKDVAQDLRWYEALPELLSDATTLLRDTLDLMKELDGANDREDGSYFHQPSISEHKQNRDFRDWTALIGLARDAWQATVERFPERARLEVENWLSIPFPLFRRLVFFAAANSTLFTPHQALGWLLADNYWWLWSVETQREILRLLITIADRLDAQDREALKQAILQGPPRAMFRDDIDPDDLRRTSDREIWLRLAKFSAGGASLGKDAAIMLETLSQQYPAWKLADDERDEFPVWMGGDEDWRTFLATPKSCRHLVNWLREHPKCDDFRYKDDWRERCTNDFRRTAGALIHLARRGEWPAVRWREALQAWSDEKLTARSWRYVGGALAVAPDEVTKELAHTLSWWLESVAKTLSGEVDLFLKLIRKILALHYDETIEPHGDPVSKAINHPIGHVTEATLRWWYRQSLEDNQGLPDVLKPIFQDLCDTRVMSFRHGRVLLATHVIALFRVDSKWAMEYLLPLFDWQRSEIEARAAWEGFLYSPRLYQPLMEAIKRPFLTTAQYYTTIGKLGKQYATLLTFSALEPGETISVKELAVATRSLPPDGLEKAAEALIRALGSAGNQRIEYWRNRILPYLKYIWPKSRDVITQAISESFARLCITAQDAFPEALQELKRWLQPLVQPHFAVHLLEVAKLCESFPEESLSFLDTVVGENAQWPPRDLKKCLDAVLNAKPELEADHRFQRIREYFRQHDRG